MHPIDWLPSRSIVYLHPRFFDDYNVYRFLEPNRHYFRSGRHNNNNNLPFQAGLRPRGITKESERRSAGHPVRSRVPSTIMWTRKMIEKVSFLFAETRIKIGRAYGSIRFTDKPGSEEWATTSGPLEKKWSWNLYSDFALWASLSNNSIMEKMSLISAVVLLFDLFIRGHVVMETLGHHQYKLKVHQ